MYHARDEADVAEIIATTDCPLELLAGGSKRAVGRPFEAEPLELGALRGILDYEPDELVLTARAATPLAEIEAVLRERGQRLAFEPPDWTDLLLAPPQEPLRSRDAARADMRSQELAAAAQGRAGYAPASAGPTLGGVLATNASGSRRPTAGAARDHFLGLRAVSGRGERFKAGGRVVKNVTGYDLPKLLAGSWGTLAVLTEVTVRVHPVPEGERTLLMPASDPASAVRIMTAALASDCEVSSAAFLPRRGAALRLEGFAPSVGARSQALLRALAALGRGTADREWLEQEDSRRLWREIGAARPLASCPVVWRVSAAPSEAPRILEQIAPPDYLLDWGGGLIWIGAGEADAARVRTALGGGHATLFKAPRDVRAVTPVFQPQPPALAALTARVKAAFDPAGRLNPGRMS